MEERPRRSCRISLSPSVLSSSNVSSSSLSNVLPVSQSSAYSLCDPLERFNRWCVASWPFYDVPHVVAHVIAYTYGYPIGTACRKYSDPSSASRPLHMRRFVIFGPATSPYEPIFFSFSFLFFSFFLFFFFFYLFTRYDGKSKCGPVRLYLEIPTVEFRY